jgi:TATA-box binding protein (TBP) (component of TFIID and TFIIIB)
MSLMFRNSSEDECKRAARGVARMIQRSMQKLDSTICLRNFRISNMMATCKLPFGVKIEELAKKYPRANYDPEITVGLVWKSEDPKASLRIHTTGKLEYLILICTKNDLFQEVSQLLEVRSLYRFLFVVQPRHLMTLSQ